MSQPRFTPEQIEAAMVACRDGRVGPGEQPELDTAMVLTSAYLSDFADRISRSVGIDKDAYFAGVWYGIALGYATREELDTTLAAKEKS